MSAIQAWIGGLSLDAGASAISLQFEDSGTANNIVTGGAGAYVDQSGLVASNWNTCASATGTNQVLKDNSGSPTLATASWQCPDTWRDGLTNTGGNDSLLLGYLDTDNTTVTSVSIKNIPYSIYNVYVYSTGDTVPRTGQFWAKSTVSPGGADPGGKVITVVTNTGTTLTDASNTGQGNYVVFKGLTNPTCVVSSQAYQYLDNANNGTRGPINGIQIVDATQSTPTLTGALASSGPTSGGQRITVLGTNLMPGATFTIGGNAATNVQYLSDKGYAMTTPAGSGAAAIVYSGINATATLNAGFTYNASPPTLGDTISYHFNESGSNGSATAMASTESAGVIARTNWNNSTASVNVNANSNLIDNAGANTGVTIGYSSNDHNTAAALADTAGNLRMMRSYIDQSNNLPLIVSANNLPACYQQFDMYVYLSRSGTGAIPSLFRINGKTVGASSGTAVSYTNAFNRVPDNNADTTQVGNYVLFPSVTPVNGIVKLEIEEPGGTYLLGVAGIQLVALAPTLTAVAASTDTGAGGTTVTLTGTNFRSNALSITFGGSAATTFSMTDSTHYSVVTPPHPQGLVDIVMTDVNGRTATFLLLTIYLYGRAGAAGYRRLASSRADHRRHGDYHQRFEFPGRRNRADWRTEWHDGRDHSRCKRHRGQRVANYLHDTRRRARKRDRFDDGASHQLGFHRW